MRAEFIRTVEAKCGCISFFADDEFIGRALQACGQYSPGEPELWAKLLRPGDQAVDVGANIGALTVPLARIVGPNGGVLAFEPQPENFGLLQRNIADNNLNSVVTAIPCALGRETGTLPAPMLCELDNANYGRVVLGKGTQRVDVVSLDAALADMAVQLQLIKIDVEGQEIEVIEGARATIARCRPLLYVENDRRDKSEALLRLIRSFDYRVFEHLPMIVPSDCHAQDNAGRALHSIVSINVLAVPQEQLERFAEVTAELRPIVPASPRLGKSGWAGVARLGGIGDNLMAASVLLPLKSMGYKVDVITSLPNGVVFENNPFVDKISIKSPKDIPADQWQAWFRTRGNEYDKFANLSHSCEVSLATLASQTQQQWPSAMRRKYYGHNYLEFVHDVLDVPYEFGPLFFPTGEERDLALLTRKRIGGGPLIGFVLNGSRFDKVYPKAPTTIARLIRELGAQVVMFGAPTVVDQQRAKQTLEYVIHQNGDDKGLHSAISPNPDDPTWPLRRSLTQLQQCDLVIGPDTGVMWAVAFEPMPKIMLHSHASVQNIVKHWIKTTSLHPDPNEVRCWPCHMLHDNVDSCLDEQRRHGMKPDPDEKGAACIQTISVEAIVQAAQRALKGETDG